MKNIFIEVRTAEDVRVSHRWLAVITDEAARKLLETTAAVVADMGQMEPVPEYGINRNAAGQVMLRQINLVRQNPATGLSETRYRVRIVTLDDKPVLL